jgi:hypothetical protein
METSDLIRNLGKEKISWLGIISPRGEETEAGFGVPATISVKVINTEPTCAVPYTEAHISFMEDCGRYVFWRDKAYSSGFTFHDSWVGEEELRGPILEIFPTYTQFARGIRAELKARALGALVDEETETLRIFLKASKLSYKKNIRG